MHAIWVSLAAGSEKAGFDWTPVWTLGGVLATGFFLLAGQALTQRTSAKQAEIQAKRDLSKWHRELRRQSYADCILAYERLRDMITPLGLATPWPVSRSLTEEEDARLDDLLVTLSERHDEAFQKCQIVRLEGPVALAEIAQQLVLAAGEFRFAAEERVRAARGGESVVEASAWNLATGKMTRELEKFFVMARDVIAVD